MCNIKYRKKPIIVEAVQFDPYNKHRLKLPYGVTGYCYPGADNWAYEGCKFSVITIHGHVAPVVAGDYIITEPDGVHHYPCKPEIFENTYDPIS